MGVEQRLAICAIRSSDKHLVTSVFNPDTNTFNGIQSHGIAGAQFQSARPPNGMMWAPNKLGLMAVDSTGWLRYKYVVPGTTQDFDAPLGWQDLGNNFLGRPAVVTWSRNRTNVFVRNSFGQMVERVYNGTSWAPGPTLGSGVQSDPAAVVQDGRRISLAAVSSSSWTNGAGRILYNYKFADAGWVNGSSWDDWGLPPSGGTFQDVSLFAWGGNKVGLFARTSTGNVHFRIFEGWGWTPWAALGPVSSRITFGAWGEEDYTLFALQNGSNNIVSNFFSNGWGGWSDFGLTCLAGSEPVAATFRGGGICVAAIDSDGKLQRRIWNGTNWGSWTLVSNEVMVGKPAIFRWIKS